MSGTLLNVGGHMNVTHGDLVLKSACSGCGTSSDLYGSSCKHMTLCLNCGKSMAEAKVPCTECGVPISKLIREYNVRSCNLADKNYFIGRFAQGLPSFSKKKASEAKWTMHKEGLKGRPVTDALRDKFKNKPWTLDEEMSQQQYQGQLEGAQNATYYLLMLHGKEFIAIPAGSWYTFNKVAQYKQLTLEEAEEKMRTRKKNAEGYQRWLMKTAKDGAAAFGELEKMEVEGGGGGGNGGRRKKGDDDIDDAVLSDRGEEDGDEEEARKNRLGLNKKGDDEEENTTAHEQDIEEEDIEKGDDWEHEEVFTDDDEAVGNDPEEREDLGPEVPAPPEIKQEDEDGEGNEEEGEGLSKSGKELKKLLGKRSGNESEEDDDEYEDAEDEIGLSPVLAPKQKDVPKEEPVEVIPGKDKASTPATVSPNTVKSSKGKRKASNEDVKPNAVTSAKKNKTEDSKQSTLCTVKEEVTPVKSNQSSKPAQVLNKPAITQSTGPVTEEEVRTVLKQVAPITTQELVAMFKARLKSQEDKASFAAILKKLSRIQRTNNANFVVLREK
eukprot:TRINITY_DN33069_c0_g1_i1.p1 TRINITY_DN33069_c0_g1~~TRINITY_DN33069_c0_g1_i1.p1  ORF type:complete len:553 (+),score=197.61 TRINITY_DN33069_c0_g1_i1:239-1897(+)